MATFPSQKAGGEKRGDLTSQSDRQDPAPGGGSPLAGKFRGHLNVEHRAGGYRDDQHDQQASRARLKQLIGQLHAVDPPPQSGSHGLAPDQQAGAKSFQ